MKTAFVSIIGRTNAGKSTLLNRMIGEKIAIVTDKPQTTRTNIRGIYNAPDKQIVFTDTPGFHKPKTRLGDHMIKLAGEAISDVDAILFVVECRPTVGRQEQELIKRLKSANKPVILIINKTDTVNKATIMETVAAYAKEFDFFSIIPISARTGRAVDIIFEELDKLLTESPAYFPEDMNTDLSDKYRVGEILREKLLLALEDEVPHGILIDIAEYYEREDKEIINVSADIVCEKDSHKGIIIGKGGAKLKEISSAAREDMEKFFGCKVFLQCFVKVRSDWRNNTRMIDDHFIRQDG